LLPGDARHCIQMLLDGAAVVYAAFDFAELLFCQGKRRSQKAGQLHVFLVSHEYSLLAKRAAVLSSFN